MRFIDVGSLATFRENAVTIVGVSGREVGVVRWRGDLYAVANKCPHEGGPLCRGGLGARLDCRHREPGALTVDREAAPVLRCPWHGWEFDVSDGTSVVDHPEWRAQTHAVIVEDGRVLVSERPRSARSIAAG